jgi:hypothetical protein
MKIKSCKFYFQALPYCGKLLLTLLQDLLQSTLATQVAFTFSIEGIELNASAVLLCFTLANRIQLV